MSEEQNLPKWIPVAVAVTTLPVPFLYLLGYVYDAGYLQVYGISNDFFARSPQEYLVFSFFIFLNVARSIFEHFTNVNNIVRLALTVGGITLVSVFAYNHRITERLHSKLVSIKEHHRLSDYIFFPVILACFAAIAPILLSAVIFIIFCSVPAIAYFQGQNGAEKEIVNTKTCIYSNSPTEECVFLLENGKSIASGRLVARSPSHIALFNQGKTTIYPVKDQLVEVIPSSNKLKKNNP